MNERTIVVGAAAVGLVAIGSLFLVSQRRNALGPKVLGLRVLPATDQAPSLVEIGIEPSPALTRLMSEGNHTCEYRVAEEEGRTDPILPSCDESARKIRVVYAYGRLKTPQIEVWIDGGRRGTTPLSTMPPPRIFPFETRSGAPVRAFHLLGSENEALGREGWNGRGGIRFASIQSLPSEERWSIAVVDTPLQNRVRFRGDEGQAVLETHRFRGSIALDQSGPDVARLFYAEDVTAVRVRVRRLLHRVRAWPVVLSGLRLVNKNGQTAIDWKDAKLPRISGLRFRIRQDRAGYQILPEGIKLPPGSADPDGDRRYPALGLLVEREKSPRPSATRSVSPALPPNSGALSSLVPDFASVSYEEAYPTISIQGDDLERLNIRNLDVGPANWSAKRPVRGPVDRRPFNMRLEVTIEWDEELGRFEATIPVESAPKR